MRFSLDFHPSARQGVAPCRLGCAIALAILNAEATRKMATMGRRTPVRRPHFHLWTMKICGRLRAIAFVFSSTPGLSEARDRPQTQILHKRKSKSPARAERESLRIDESRRESILPDSLRFSSRLGAIGEADSSPPLLLEAGPGPPQKYSFVAKSTCPRKTFLNAERLFCS